MELENKVCTEKIKFVQPGNFNIIRLFYFIVWLENKAWMSGSTDLSGNSRA